MAKAKDIQGDVFGRWRVESRAPNRADGKAAWWCACACGSARRQVTGADLRNGSSTSCGCARTEGFKARFTTHGHTRDGRKHPLYNVWANMKRRCYSPEAAGYVHYGARGIGVCAAWRNDFAKFLSDMGNRPTPSHTLERIDNDGDYTPDNCRWATRAEQAGNRRCCSDPCAAYRAGLEAELAELRRLLLGAR